MTQYKAPWDTTLQVVSLLTTGLLLGVAAMPLLGPIGPVRILPLALLVGALPFVVRGYEIRGDALLIRRLLWSTRIELTGLRSAQYDPAVLCHSIRTCGNGGLFSFTGWYWNRKIGAYHAYATDLRRAVVLTFARRRVVVTPDRPDDFVRALSVFCGC